MREVVTGRAQRGVPRRRTPVCALVILAIAVCALAAAAPAFAASSPAPVSSGSPVPLADPSPVAQSLSCELSAATVAYGEDVTVTGALAPALADQDVTVKLGAAVAGTAKTAADGSYTVTFKAAGKGSVSAVLTADPTVVSPAAALSVTPKVVSVSHSSLVPFLPATFTVRVAPVAYDTVIAIRVVHRKAVVGFYKARVKDGRATFKFPLRGVDGFALQLALPAFGLGDGGLDPCSVQYKVAVPAKTLAAGSHGPYVKGMLTALNRLKFRVPNLGTSFDGRVKDSVMAFQKAYGLSRTYVFSTTCWRKIDGAKLIKARHASPSTHLEVDKGRQIAMVVKGGKPFGIICVSTGATGNTPEGTFHIQQKHPYTTSGFGGILTRTMGFVGNFAMHGYVPVPPYPASHGCVREPVWACYWMYDQSWVGETLYIYH